MYQQLISQHQHKPTAKTSADLHKAQHEDIKALQKSTPSNNNKNNSTTEPENNTTATDTNQQLTTKEQSNNSNTTVKPSLGDTGIIGNNNRTQDSTNSTIINNSNNQNVASNQTQQQQPNSDQPVASQTGYPFLAQQLQQLQQRQLTQSSSQLLSTLSSLYPDYASAIAKAAIAYTVPNTNAVTGAIQQQTLNNNPLLDRLIETMKNTQTAAIQNPLTLSSIQNPTVTSSTDTPHQQKVEVGAQLTTPPSLSKSLDINNLQPLDLANLITNPGNPVASLVEAAKSYNALDDITANKKSTQNDKPTGANQVRNSFYFQFWVIFC